MALAEEQIVRYSRQILLAQVGGQGQERLLGTCVKVMGAGAAQSTAVAYLAASGCAVEEGLRPLQVHEQGVLYADRDVQSGARADQVLGRSAYALNPDSVREAVARSERPFQTVACVGELPARFTGAGPWVAIGARGGRAAVIYRSEQGCESCFVREVEGLEALGEGLLPELVGALAALTLQRVLLGMGEALGGLWVDAQARIDALDFGRCQECRP